MLLGDPGKGSLGIPWLVSGRNFLPLLSPIEAVGDFWADNTVVSMAGKENGLRSIVVGKVTGASGRRKADSPAVKQNMRATNRHQKTDNKAGKTE